MCVLKPRSLGFKKKYIYIFIWLHCVYTAACGTQFPDQGLNPGLMDWELGVLATGPPREVPGLLSKVPASWLHHVVCLQAVFWYLLDWVWGPVWS